VFFAFVFSTASVSIAHGSPFQLDDFEDGNAEDGSPFTWTPGGAPGGTRTVINGDYLISNSALSSSYAPEASGVRDATITTQLRMTSAGNNGFAGIFVRSPTTASYWAGIDWNGTLYVGESPGSDGIGIRESVVSSLAPRTTDVLLELSAVGDQVNFYAWELGQSRPAMPQLSFQDVTLPSGPFGFVINGQGQATTVAYRWFEAVPEPTTITLLIIGSIGAGLLCRKRLMAWRPVAVGQVATRLWRTLPDNSLPNRREQLPSSGA
jgi:hypothetical protein